MEARTGYEASRITSNVTNPPRTKYQHTIKDKTAPIKAHRDMPEKPHGADDKNAQRMADVL